WKIQEQRQRPMPRPSDWRHGAALHPGVEARQNAQCRVSLLIHVTSSIGGAGSESQIRREEAQQEEPCRASHRNSTHVLALAIICHPRRDEFRLCRSSRSNTAMAPRAASEAFCAGLALTSLISFLPRRITRQRYRLKKGNPTPVTSSGLYPAARRRLSISWQCQCFRCPMYVSKADIGPPGAVNISQQPSFM